MASRCDHPICNALYEPGCPPTLPEVTFILWCLVERGQIEVYGIDSDTGQFLFQKKTE